MDGIAPRSLNRRLVLLQPGNEVHPPLGEPNQFGETIINAQYASHQIWGSRREAGGGESLMDDQERATGKVIFRIWYRADVNEQWLIVEYDPAVANPNDIVPPGPGPGTIYDIKHIAEIGRREGLEITGERRR